MLPNKTTILAHIWKVTPTLLLLSIRAGPSYYNVAHHYHSATIYRGVFIVCVWDCCVCSGINRMFNYTWLSGCIETDAHTLRAAARTRAHTHAHKATWAHAVFVSEHWFINAPSEKLLWLRPEPQAPAKLKKCRRNKGRGRKWERVTVMNRSTVTVEFPVCSCLIQPDLWWLGEEFNHGNQLSNFEFQCFKNVEAIFRFFIPDCIRAAWH